MRRVVCLLVISACSRTELDGAAIDAGDVSVDEPVFVDAHADDVADSSDASVFPWPDAALAEACRNVSRIIHIETDGGFPIDASAATVTGSTGVWTSSVSGQEFFQLRVDSSWGVAAMSDWLNGHWLEAGTYTSSGDAHSGWWAQVEALDGACNEIPTGTFTIYEIEIAYGSGTSESLAKLLMTFELRCNGQGSLVGCARFE